MAKDIRFVKKKLLDDIRTNISSSVVEKYRCDYNKLATCPHCNISTDSWATSYPPKKFFDDSELIFFNCQCTGCQKFFFTFYEFKSKDKELQFIQSLPHTFDLFIGEHIPKYFPRFVELYNQAAMAEADDCIDIAAMGYRAALEILVKGYAIDILKEESDKIEKKSLCDSIELIFAKDKFLKTADVVRILGNDYAHFKRKYPQHDLSTLKKYFNIFISAVETELSVIEAPVTR